MWKWFIKILNDSTDIDILENTILIETLKNTKDKAQELKASLQSSETTRKDLYLQRANYIIFAKRGAVDEDGAIHKFPALCHSIWLDYMEIVKQYDYILRPYESYSLDWVGEHAVKANKI